MERVEELYKSFGILADAGDKAGEEVSAYQTILSSVKGSSAEKKLACQFIPRFFAYFPNLAESAIDAQLDLCEEEEASIRRQAIKSLPDFCITSNEHIPRITDILTQLLQQEDATELSIVRSGLEKLILKDPEAALGGIFLQISVGDDIIREKAINFLTHMTQHCNKLMQEDKIGQSLLSEVTKVLSDVSADEFAAFVSMLTKVKSVASDPQSLADLITAQAELDKPFSPSEPEMLNRIITCARQATPFFMKGASPIKYMDYLFLKEFPVFSDIKGVHDVDYKYEVLKIMADLSNYACKEAHSKTYIDTLLPLLISYMPLPPVGEVTENDEKMLKELNFSYVECLLFTLHKFGGGGNAGSLNPDEPTSIFKDFKQRLPYFGRMTQIYIKQLQHHLQNTSGNKMSEHESKVKSMALKTCVNINTLIKDFLHNPPSFKSHVVVSWKSSSSGITLEETVEEKRKRAGIVPISVDNLPKKSRTNIQGIYKVPSSRKAVKMEDNYVSKFGNPNGNKFANNRYRYNRNYSKGRNSNYNNQSQKKETYENFLFR